MKKFFKIILISIIVLVAAALALFYFYPKYAQNIVIPDIDQVEKINIQMKGDTAFSEVRLLLENKGLFKINIDSLDYAVNFDTMRVLSKQQDLDVVLQPGASDTFNLPVALPFKRIGERIRQLQERDSADIVTEIRIVYSTLFGRAVLPHKKTSRIGMPRPPKVTLEKVEFDRIEGKFILMNAQLRMHNRGKIDLVVRDLKYKVSVEDLFTAEGKEPDAITIKPGAVVNKTIPIKVRIKKGFKTARLILTDQDVVNYNLDISASLEAERLGDEPAGVTLNKKGKFELKK